MRTMTLSRAMGGFALLLGLHFAIPGAAMAQTPRASRPIRIVALGDSLSAGYLLALSESFPSQLQRALRAKGHSVEIVNAGVSGDTAAAGLDRVDWAVPPGTDGVIVELGANDALRGHDPASTRASLAAVITKLQARQVDILLAGMLAPRNLGETYARAFDAIYPELARVHGLPLYPFFLDGIALKPELNLADGIHPNARGVAVIVAGILPLVEQLIGRIEMRRR